jgi:hypothetical protein
MYYIKKFNTNNFYFNFIYNENYLYYLSLNKCLYGFDICGIKIKWIIRKLSQAIISYFILALLLELILLNIASKFHLIHILIVYYYFYNYSHGLDFHDHGYFNFLGYITIVSLILLALMPFNGLLFFIKKIKYYIFYIYWISI